MSMFNDISWGSKDNKIECESNAQLVSLFAGRFGAGPWSFLGPGSEKKWSSISEDCPQGEWAEMAEKTMVTLAESGHPVFRATSPLSRGVLKLSIHYCADQDTITTVFRTITSVNQLSLHGAVADMCEEYESFHDRTEKPSLGGQSSSSFVPSVIKTNVPLNNDDHAHKDLLLQRYGERIEKLSQQDKLSKFCMDAGFLSVVEIGQYFMTKDTGDVTQFHAVACREYTLPREEPTSQPKGWIQGNTKIGPVLEVATCCLHGKYGGEIRISSVNRDNSHSWVRIFHGSNKFVMNLNNNETEIPEVQLEEYALKLDAKDLACRTKAQAKPQRREPAGSSPRTVSIGRRNWIDIEPGKYYFSECEVSKKVIHLLRHSQKVHREEDGAVHFWRMKENGTIVYFRALHGHSGRNLIDPSLQDNVVIPSNFFQYIYHIGCAFNLHSIINSGLILGGQNSSKRQTIFFLPIDPMDKSHKDPVHGRGIKTRYYGLILILLLRKD